MPRQRVRPLAHQPKRLSAPLPWCDQTALALGAVLQTRIGIATGLVVVGDLSAARPCFEAPLQRSPPCY
jgi:class 3 adenylate cyclase